MTLTRNRRSVARSLAFAAALSSGALALTSCGAAQPGASPTPAGATTSTSPVSGSAPRGNITAPSGELENAARGWCESADLEFEVAEHVSPEATGKLFAIHLTAADKTYCTIGGTLSDISFTTEDGDPIDIEIGGGQDPEHTEINLGDRREAVAYIRTTGAGNNPGLPVAAVSFTLPGKGVKGDGVTVTWPAPFDGPILVTNLMEPVG
ncbi:hypothetical protein ACQPZF_12015 [Actinosynnema sp. CS-041913]|uniref:hypothetical protein n=1 Tax=Actinosynnema sp. CS-041913 TaxID=3239917 RepID=UPI003D89FDD2